MEAPIGGYKGTLEPVEINDFNIWFLHHFPKVSLRACNEHAVRMSHNLKNRRHGIFKARSPYAPFEGHLGEEFKPVWEGGQVALFNLSNRCFVSATKSGQLLSDCNTSSPGPHELFDVESRNELVAFRSAHGTYIGLESGGEKLVCSATAAGSSELFQIRLKAYIQVNNGHYVSAERNHSLIAQRFRPGIPARGDSFILEVGTTHCSFRSQYNRYWVAESNGNLSAVTPASSSRKSAREEFKLEGYRSDLLEPEHIYFGIRTTHGTFVISEDDKIVTVSHDAIQKNVAMASRVGYCFTDHLFEILPQPSSPLSPTSSSSTSSASSPSSSSADFSRSPSFSWAKQSFPPHTLATSSNSGSTHTRRERTESESGNGSPEDSIRYRIGARLRQRVDRKLHRGAPSRDGEGEETNNKQSGGRGGRTTPNAFPHRSKSLSDHLERSGGRDRDLLAPNPEQQVKRADTEPVDRRHAGVAKSSEALPTYSDRGRRKQENSSGSGGASGGRSGDRMRSVVGSDGDFEAIEVFVDDEEQSDDIEDGWEEITEGSSDDYGYFEARLRAQQGNKSKSPPKPNEALSPRSAAAVEAKTGTAVTTTGFDQMAGEWVIDPRDLQLSDRVLGKGFFGEVKKGRWRGTPVAAKIIYRELFRSKSDEQLFDKEVRMLRSLHHPHVIQFLGVCQFKEKRQRCIVTELMEKGSLHDLLRNEATLFKDPLLRVRIARDIAKGMCYLHMSDPPTLHRDLTSKNILLDRFLRAKIADFGLSRFKEENGVFTQGCGALAFMAPEVYRGEAYSEKADVYSYAIILWEMWNMGKYPHEVAWMDQLAYAAECALRDYRPQLSDDIPEAWRQLITLCWHKSPSARPSFSHILNILKQLTRITRGGGGGVEYLDLGDYMAEALLLEEAENGTSSPRHKNDKPLAANAPTARDNHHSQQPPISPRANQQAPQHQQQRRNDNRRSGESETEEADDEKRNEGGGEEREDSGYWSERKVEKRLKKAALHTITPRSAQPPTVQRTGGGGGSSGRGCDVNYVDQDRATSMHYAITGDEFQFAEQEVVGGVTMEQRHGEGEHEEVEVVDNAIVQTVSTSGVDASSSYSAPLFVKEETIYEDVDFLVPQSQERTVSPDRNREGWLLVMAKRKTP